MTDLVVYGFPRSTFVNIVRMVLTYKDVPYRFHDLEPEMGKPSHLALHPFDRVPILRHGDFTLYETSAIVTYLDETFPRLPLQPRDIPGRARMDQWISMINSYYYPYMIYHVTHERLVFPELGIAWLRTRFRRWSLAYRWRSGSSRMASATSLVPN
jgi:glutathione S-transferase